MPRIPALKHLPAHQASSPPTLRQTAMASWLSDGASDPLSAFSRAVRSSYRSHRTASPTTMFGLCRPTPSKPPPAYPFADQHAGDRPENADAQSISSGELYNLPPSQLLQRVQSLADDYDTEYDDEGADSDDGYLALTHSHDTTSQSSAHSTGSSNPSLHHIPLQVTVAGPLRPSPSPLLHVDPLKEVLTGYLDLIKLLQESAAVRSRQPSNFKSHPLVPIGRSQACPTPTLAERPGGTQAAGILARPAARALVRQLTVVPRDDPSSATHADRVSLSDQGSTRSPSPTVSPTISPPWVRGGSRDTRSSSRRLKITESGRRGSRTLRSVPVTPTTPSAPSNTYDAPCGNPIVYRVAVEHSPGSLSVGT